MASSVRFDILPNSGGAELLGLKQLELLEWLEPLEQASLSVFKAMERLNPP